MSEGLGRGWVVGRVKGGPTATAEAPGTAPALSCCGGSSGHKAKALENTITLPLPTQGEPLRDYKDHSRKDRQLKQKVKETYILSWRGQRGTPEVNLFLKTEHKETLT